GHPRGRTAVRSVQGRGLRDAGHRGHPGGHRAGRAVADRAVHRGTSPGQGNLPHPREGGGVTTVDAPVEIDPSGLPRAPAPGVWKTPTMFGVFTVLLAAIVFFNPAVGDTTFRLATPTDFVQLPELVVPANGTAWLPVALMACATGVA